MALRKSTRALIFGGLFFLIPFLLVIILGGKAIKILSPLGHVISDSLELHSIFGKTSVFIVCLLLILGICLVSGYFIQKGIFKKWSSRIEEQLFIHFPSLQVFKYKLIGDDDTIINEFWEAIILKEDHNGFNIAFITETSNRFYTLYIPDAPKIDAGEVRYVLKTDITFYRITMKQAMSALYNFGKGLDPDTIIKD